MNITVRRAVRCLLIGLGAVLRAACQSAGLAAPHRLLKGTSWELLAIHGPDHTSPVIRPDDPARFTVRFDAGRRVLLRLDCNRGIGKWRSDSGSASAGQLSFGSMAVTRALCAPPHLDERIARELGFVRAYAIKNGRLYLSPTSDGGVLEWRPYPSPPRARALRP